MICQNEKYRLIELRDVFILLELEGERISRHIYSDEKQALEAMDNS